MMKPVDAEMHMDFNAMACASFPIPIHPRKT
mgnify:CR=1 FL=1